MTRVLGHPSLGSGEVIPYANRPTQYFNEFPEQMVELGELGRLPALPNDPSRVEPSAQEIRTLTTGPSVWPGAAPPALATKKALSRPWKVSTCVIGASVGCSDGFALCRRSSRLSD